MIFKNCRGKISKIKLINTSNRLTRFTLTLTDNQSLTCLATNKIADKILQLPDDTILSVFGRMNKRNQLVVDKVAIDFATLHY